MTNQDESNGASNGMEDNMIIDNVEMDTHPDLRDYDIQPTNSDETRLDDNVSQTSFENGNDSGQHVDEEDATSSKEEAVN